MLPLRLESGQHIAVDRLDLAAKCGERTAPQDAQNVPVTPFPFGAVGAELSSDQPAFSLQLGQRCLGPGGIDTQAGCELAGEERTVGAGEPADEVEQRMVDRIGERRREPGRQSHSQRVTQSRRVFGGCVVTTGFETDFDDAPLIEEFGESDRGIEAVDTIGHLVDRERPQPSQEIFEPVDVSGLPGFGCSLKFGFELGEHFGVEEFPQLLGAQQVVQQITVERQGRRPALGQRSVAFVHVLSHPTEQQTAGHRRGRVGVDRVNGDLAGSQIAQNRPQGRDVEHIVQTFTGGLQKDREARVLGRHREQIGRLLPLLPQWSPAVRATTRQQQRPSRALAEASRKHCGVGQLGDEEVVEVIGIYQQLVDRNAILGLGQPNHDAVVGPHELHIPAPLFGHPVLERHPPWSVNLGAERRENTDPPVADFVAESFDDDRAIGWQLGGDFPLFFEIHHQVLSRQGVQTVALGQPLDSGISIHGIDLPNELAHGSTQFERAAGPVAMPERHLARLAWSRGDHDPLMGDVLDPPGGRSEEERLASPGFVHHLLIELTDPGAVGEEDAVQASIGNGAAAGYREALRTGPTPDHTLNTIPNDPGSKLGELIGGIAASQQIEHIGEPLIAQIGKVG